MTAGRQLVERAISAGARARLRRPPVLWREIVLIAICFAIYSLLQDHGSRNVGAALHHGRELLRVEVGLHIDIEHALNTSLAGVEPLAVLANYFYISLHFLVPIGVLLWLYAAHRASYLAERRVLLMATLVSLAGFYAFPTAPPRMLPGAGFIDTLARFDTIGGYESGPTRELSDQFAAMPSVHVVFACWVGLVMFRYAAHRVVRVAWLFYPAAMIAVILGTGNHYLLDVFAGFLTLAIGAAVSAGLSGIGRAITARTEFGPVGAALPGRVGRGVAVLTAAYPRPPLPATIGCGERPIQVSPQVGSVLTADAEPEQPRR